MIQIDIDMPKNCMCCPFPSVGTDYYYCYCPGVEGRAYDFKQAESIPDDCPLHEVTEDTDTISRQDAIDAVEFGITYAKAINKSTGEVKELFKEGNKALNEAVERLKELPPSPTPSRPHDISTAKFSCPICGAEMEVTVDEWDEGGAV